MTKYILLFERVLMCILFVTITHVVRCGPRENAAFRMTKTLNVGRHRSEMEPRMRRFRPLRLGMRRLRAEAHRMKRSGRADTVSLRWEQAGTRPKRAGDAVLRLFLSFEIDMTGGSTFRVRSGD